MSRAFYCPDCKTIHVVDHRGRQKPEDDQEADIDFICGRSVELIRSLRLRGKR